MTDEEDKLVKELKAALRKRQAAEDKAAEIKAAGVREYEKAVASVLLRGMNPAAVADVLGTSYETVRRMARRQGVDRLREPTVTSRRKADPPDSG